MADSLFEGAFAINDANPEASVPSVEARNAAPLEMATFIMELGERADRAQKRGDHAAAARYYTALVMSVPDRAQGYAKLCRAHEAAGDRPNALKACARALRLPGVTLADFSEYAQLVLSERGEISPDRIKDLDALLAHLQTQVPGSLLPAQLRCDIGVRLLDVARLTQCTTELRQSAPNDPKTLSYEWTLALRQKDYTSATLVVERAKQSTMRPDAVEVMERVTRDLASPWTRMFQFLRSKAGLAIGAGALLLLASLSFVRHRPRLPRYDRRSNQPINLI
jgi:tetratricopeptide (TPR) repeat protein